MLGLFFRVAADLDAADLDAADLDAADLDAAVVVAAVLRFATAGAKAIAPAGIIVGDWPGKSFERACPQLDPVDIFAQARERLLQAFRNFVPSGEAGCHAQSPIDGHTGCKR